MLIYDERNVYHERKAGAEAARTAAAILEMREHNRARITERLGRAAANGHRILERLFDHPIVNVATVRDWLGVTPAGANNLVRRVVDDAMVAIERDNPALKDVLPKDYARPALDKTRLGLALDLVSNIRVGDEEARSKDVLGRAYDPCCGGMFVHPVGCPYRSNLNTDSDTRIPAETERRFWGV